MNKVVVICDVEHEITAGVCAFCERDQARTEVESLRLRHTGEGTFACTCHSYPHTPDCGTDERIIALRQQLAEARAIAERDEPTIFKAAQEDDEERARLRTQLTSLNERHLALLKQNVQQERELEEKDAAHKEEKERADMLHDLLRLSQGEVERLKEQLVVGEAGGRLLKVVQEETDAQLAKARETLAKAHEWIAWPWDQRDVGRMTPREILSVIAKTLVQEEPLIETSLVCEGCGGKINADYGKCRRCN